MIDDPGGDRPRAIEELDNLHIGPAPIGALIDAGTSMRRRRRAVLASVAAVLVILVGGGLVSTQVFGTTSDDGSLIADGDAPSVTSEPRATLHAVTIDTEFKSGEPLPFYDEGALEEVRLERASPSGSVLVESETAFAPWQRAWKDLPSGEYTISAAVRPCAGNCGYLDAPTDTCEQTFDLDSDVAVTVEFEYGKSCSVALTSQEASTPAQQLPVSVDVLAPDGDEAVPKGTARWYPESQTLAYVSSLDYSGSCLPEGSAATSDGSLSLVLAVPNSTECTADANTVLATVTGLAEAPAELTVTGDGEARTIAVETPLTPETTNGLLRCPSGPTIVRQFEDFALPSSPEEAEKRPATPEEAALLVLGGALFSGDDSLVLGSPERAETFGFPVLTSTGAVVGRITVETVGFGAYGATTAERCAP